MPRRLFAGLCLAFAPLCIAQTPEVLGFEAAPDGHWPGGWTGHSPPDTIWLDSDIVHGGRHSVRLERNSAGAGQFSTISIAVPVDFTGSKVELRGFLRTESVSGFAGLWMREDGESTGLAFDNMQARHLNGTTDWIEYSIVLPIDPRAKELYIGVLSTGTGKTWADDLRLLVDGKPIGDVPKTPKPKSALDLDHEFDQGSRITLTGLTPLQIDNLASLGKVWGFLKYHHPVVVSGGKHWDYELFRVLPAVLAAPDRERANAAMLRWIEGLGPVAACSKCASLDEKEIYLRPALEWLKDETRLGKGLSAMLQTINRNRPADGKQFFVSMVPHVGNPTFEHEPAYARIPLPDAGFQLLGLYRFWNIVAWWYPNRDILDEDWDHVLADSIPKIALARDAASYKLQMMALIARVHDTHANLWSSLAVRPPAGICQAPVNVRFIGDRAIVTSYAADEGAATGLKPGDEITAIDGTPVATLVKDWTPWYADSNQAARLRDMGRSLTQGGCGEAVLGVRRAEGDTIVKAARLPTRGMKIETTHDLPGDAFRLLSPEVAYLKLSNVKAADSAHYVEEASKSKGLVIDIRNYPSEFVVFALGSLLAEKETLFVRFTGGDLENPGAFHWTAPTGLSPAEPHYAGKVVVLVDEVSQSQAEYTAMAFRSAGALVVGSTTAGADGNVSAIPLPGGLSSMISGIGVFYPDKRPTQRVGIVPDVEVRPTIEGIRAGRDEVLEAGIRAILGAGAAPDAVEKMARH